MGIHHNFPILVFMILALLSPIVYSRYTLKNLSKIGDYKQTLLSSSIDEGTNWAVLVAGSRGYGNYRHQSDICHAYQILKRGGLKDDNIIVFMYDDIADNENNPRKGTIINNPKGEDVYKGVPKDYTGEDLTTSNLLGVILGNKTAINGGSGKVVNSGPNDRIFIYYSDHGSPGVLTMPNDDDLYAKDFIDTLKKKHEMGTYKSMVIYVEACEAGSIFEGLLKEEWNIYVTTASNPDESSWATYCPGFDPTPPPEFQTCLGDLYSVAWMEDSELHNTQSETLKKQYQVVKKRTAAGGEHGSHVMEYGYTNIGTELLSNYLGSSTSYSTQLINHNNLQLLSSINVQQHEADLLYLKQKVLRAPEGSMKRKEAQKELDGAISHRQNIDTTFKQIGKSLFGDVRGYETIQAVRSPGLPIVDDWDCFKTLVETYKTHCGKLSTYGKKHMRAFANMCNAGVGQSQFSKVVSQVCNNNNL